MKNRTIKTVKRKTTGIILAVFLGLFAWIYTWKFDREKFWGALIANVLLWWTVVVPIATYIWAIVDMSVKDKDKYENYYKWKVK